MKKRHRFIYRSIMYFLLFLLLMPLAVIILWSVSKNWPWPSLYPQHLGLRGWVHLLNPASKSLKILLYSIFLSMVVTLITLMISMPAAKALGIYEFKGKRFFKMLILAPIIVPPVAVAMGIHVAFIRMGLANTFLGVVLVHLIPCIPYAVRILMNVFEILGESMEMQARVLGARPLQTFIHVTLPLMIPGLLSAGSMVFIISFSQYFLTFLIGGGRVVTFSMLMFPYIQSGDRMIASVYSLAFIVTTLLILVIVEKSVKTYYKGDTQFYL